MAQEKPKDEEKELKRLMEAHVTVLKHQLGRVPTSDEIVQSLSQVQKTEQPMEPNHDAQQETDAMVPSGEVTTSAAASEQNMEEQRPEPKVFGMRVFYGMKNDKGADGKEKRLSDPFKILFYESPDRRIYDTNQHEWLNDRPGIMDHLPSRELLFDENGHDVMAALMHGVLDDEDYAELDRSGMLNDYHKQIWDLNKQLQAQMQGLEKSGKDDTTGTNPPQDSDAATTPTAEVAGADAKIEKPKGEPLTKEGSTSGEPAAPAATEAPATSPTGEGPPSEGTAGENLVEQIVNTALAKADSHLRQIVREEIQDAVAQIMANMESEVPQEPQEFDSFQPQGAPGP